MSLFVFYRTVIVALPTVSIISYLVLIMTDAEGNHLAHDSVLLTQICDTVIYRAICASARSLFQAIIDHICDFALVNKLRF